MSQIKSIDFKIEADGHGVVNWNGPTTLQDDGATIINNHTLPKLRGYTNLTGKVSEKNYKLKKSPAEIDFKENPLYISQNCTRHHLYKSNEFDVSFAGEKTAIDMLLSEAGLVRGYVVPSSQYKRSSALLLEDLVDQLGNGNFEQFGKSGSKEKTLNKKGKESSSSFFSKTTFGDTRYIGYGSINVEQLQFISLDKKFDRAALVIKDTEGEGIAQKVTDFVKSINHDSSLNPEATFGENYVRTGTVYNEGEVGIKLNDDAVTVLINVTIKRIQDLVIRQGKGYMYVTDVLVDYNDDRMMRIKKDESSINEVNPGAYVPYFEDK
jgi:hypothetical protein